MATALTNPWRGKGLDLDCPYPIADPSDAAALLQHCPSHAKTPLRSVPQLAAEIGVDEIWVKDERTRMGLGSFKALGAAHAIAREAALARGEGEWSTALNGRTFVTASAGNHGLSVAAGARIFGAEAVIYLAKTVPQAFGARLQAKGARVVVSGDDYEASMEAASVAATESGWTLLSDSSWPGYIDLPLRVMEGYLQLSAEAADEIPAPPTHVLLQAGVGGLAAAVAAHVRHVWQDEPEVIVVEPNAAPALTESIRAGRMVTTTGPVSAMGRLDCKTPSLIALKGLSKDTDLFVTISEGEGQAAANRLALHGLETTPSGGAGLAALLAGVDLGRNARVLAILSEGPEDG